MKPSVAIVAQGAMGAGIANLLVQHGASVVTSLEGRSAASRARALSAGMTEVPFEQLVQADLVLSIVPPIAALAFANAMSAPLRNADRKPVFVDCNAVSPQTLQEVAAVIAPTGAPFVDASIIGLAPRAGERSPHLYASGEHAGIAAPLAEHGLDLRLLEARSARPPRSRWPSPASARARSPWHRDDSRGEPCRRRAGAASRAGGKRKRAAGRRRRRAPQPAGWRFSWNRVYGAGDVAVQEIAVEFDRSARVARADRFHRPRCTRISALYVRVACGSEVPSAVAIRETAAVLISSGLEAE